MDRIRRNILRGRGLAVAGLVMTLVLAIAPPGEASERILEPFADDFERPLFVDAPAGDDRVFVVEQTGRIRIVDTLGVVTPTPFLDIRSLTSTGGERGLLGLAFHPEYATNRLFYVMHTISDGSTVLAEYRTSSSDPNRAIVGSRRVVMTVPQPAGNHNGGMIAFGPDGYLYVALGDGGGGGDTYGNGQDRESLLGAILRIDVDTASGYDIPGDGRNPFDGSAGADEIWVWGVRNPWRFSFDTATGLMYVADVGQNAREEVTVVPGGPNPGWNLGWNILEGDQCYSPSSGCTAPADYLAPDHVYAHSVGRSITGGYVYRGSEHPDLVGRYHFGDFITGRTWTLRYDGGSVTDVDEVTSDYGTIPLLSSFGTDGFQELYATSITGSVYRISRTADRLAGPDRYATAAAVSSASFPNASIAYVVTGTSFPDGLVAGSIGDGPVLLTRPDTLPSATRAELERLGPLDTIYLLGGGAAVSTQVEAELGAYADDVVRVSGPDRYATAAAFSSSFGRTGGAVYLATGADFADALVAGAAAGAEGGSLLLTRPTSLPASTAAELDRIDPDRIIVVGGTAAVSDAVASAAATHGPVTRIAGSNRYATAAAVSAGAFAGGGPVLVATGQDFPDAMVASAAAIAGGGPVLLTRMDSVPSPTAVELRRLAPSSSAVVGGTAVITDRASAQVHRSAR